MTNLNTSCIDCNRGKSGIPLNPTEPPKPCPFCGCDVSGFNAPQVYRTEDGRWQCECICGARAPIGKNLGAAWWLWNYRDGKHDDENGATNE